MSKGQCEVGVQRLALDDCRTVAEVEERLRVWIEGIQAATVRELETTALLDPHVDVDELDAALEQQRRHHAMLLDEAMSRLRTMVQERGHDSRMP